VETGWNPLWSLAADDQAAVDVFDLQGCVGGRGIGEEQTVFRLGGLGSNGGG